MDSVTILPLVSICIPTFNRPHLLEAALQSCLVQTYRNFEIIVGDDSKEDGSQVLITEYQARYPGKIRYIRNIPSLGQAENVNSLFNNAAGARLVLLHDDDLLLPEALQDLSDCWALSPALAASFGKQYIMDVDGKILLPESERLNLFFGRIKTAAGSVVPALAGIQRMFPNDGYMISTEVARKIGYRPFSEVGEACDFDFALRFCADVSSVWFHDGYTAIYRISGDAISKTAITAPYVYRILNEYKFKQKEGPPADIEEAIDKALVYFAPRALSGYARMGQGREALRILFSANYTVRERFRPRFLLHSTLTLSALVAGSRGANAVLAALKWFVGFKKSPEISG